MRTIIASCLLAFLAMTAGAQSFHNTPLIEALQAISNSQSNYTIDILSDGLGNLHTSANVTGLATPDAVKRLCKGLPVKVKTKGRVISVQPKKGVPQRHEVEIRGEVEDGFLKIPLAHVKVSICRADSSVLVDSATNTLAYGHGDRLQFAMYTAKVATDAAHLLVHAQLKGYDDVWQRADIGKRTEVEMPTLEMRKMREIQLGEVVIKSTKVKMFWRGDTIVYDATAFNLPKGSMLDDLIRQMPGVTLNAQGQIFVNGRMVDELLLGSRSFMRGNKRVLMENLPYYTVKEVKVYEKQTDRSVALGYDVDPKRYVMDVNLKQEYQRGYIANVEGAAGNEDRWLGRAFVLAFSDHYRFTLLGNANNVNETRHIGQSDSWTPATMPKNMLTTRSVAGEMSYYAKGDVVKNNLTASYTSTTDVSETRSRYEQFLQGLTPTSLTESANRTGNQRWSAHNELTLKKPFYVFAIADFNYSKNHGALGSMFQQWTADSLTASQHTDGFSNGKAWNGYIEAQGSVNIGHDQQHVNYYVKAERMENESESARSYCTRQYATTQQNNVNDISNSTTWGIASLSYSNKISKAVNMQVGEAMYLSRINAHDWLYHPIDTLLLPSQTDALRAVTDVNNSYDSRQNIAENTLSVSFFQNGQYKYRPNLPYTVGYQRWNVGIGIPIRHESLSYQRGSLDTLARQNTVFLNASASFRYVPEDGKHDFRVHASHKRSGASLSDRITYRDDSQPLVVKLGNPDLKSSVTSNFGIDYSNKAGRNYQQWHIGASADIYHRQTAQSVSYNLTSGVYTYKPTNVSGAYRLNAKFDLSRTIDKNRYWSWQTNADAGYHHSIDHAMLTGDTESHVNTVNTLTLHDNAYIQYNKGTLNVRATGDIRWRHSEGKMYDFETLNATDFQYGLSARYTLPRLNTTLSADGNMYSRRGYGSSELNNDDFVLNASVSQPFFKGKLIARIEAFDLLHQLSSTQYAVNAQGRTETWYRSLPHYVMLHLVYHWNKNPKKK